MSKVTPFLMFDDQLEEALRFYTATFPDSEILSVGRAGEDGPLRSAEFVVGGQRFKGFNGGSHFSFSEGVSLFVDCADQAEVDRYWDAIVAAGGTPSQCGWIKDPYGLSWQIVPRRFVELIGDEDPKKVKAVTEAMLRMEKLDVAALERAYAEEGEGRARDVVQRYLEAANRHDVAAALAHLRDDFQLEFKGGPTLGKRAVEEAMGWDRGTSGRISWRVVSASDDRVTVEGEETNVFLSLLGSAPLGFRSRFEVDEAGRIARQEYEVQASGPPVPELLEPSVSWAERHAPDELAAVYPDGRLVYTEEMGRKWVRLLRDWREAVGGRSSRPPDGA